MHTPCYSYRQCVALIYVSRPGPGQNDSGHTLPYHVKPFHSRAIPCDSIRFSTSAGKSLTATWHLGTFGPLLCHRICCSRSMSPLHAQRHTNTYSTPTYIHTYRKFSIWPKVTWHAYKLSAIKFTLTFWPCSVVHPTTALPLLFYHYPSALSTPIQL